MMTAEKTANDRREERSTHPHRRNRTPTTHLHRQNERRRDIHSNGRRILHPNTTKWEGKEASYLVCALDKEEIQNWK